MDKYKWTQTLTFEANLYVEIYKKFYAVKVQDFVELPTKISPGR